jgi:hypothetical protein
MKGATVEATIVALFFIIFVLGGLAVWLYALIDVIRTPDHQYQTGTQLIWVLVVLFANILGALIYLAIGRPQQRT